MESGAATPSSGPAVDRDGAMADPVPPRLTLLSRAYCSLCGTMQDAVTPLAAASGLVLDVVDVDAHPSLVEAWGDLVPVLFLGEPAAANELCHYHFDHARIAAALTAVGARPAPAVARGAQIR
jgi:thioredoxin reductase (NADPH)